MSDQSGPRDVAAVLASRYTLTEAGWEAARQAEAAIASGEIDPVEPTA